MTKEQFYSCLKVLSIDTNKLIKDVQKLRKYIKKKKRPKDFDLRLQQIQQNFIYLQKLFTKLDNDNQWNYTALELDPQVWGNIQQEYTDLFLYIERTLNHIRNSSGVM